MKYYEIGLNARGLRGHQTLTYASEEELQPGDIVSVSLRSKQKAGVVVSEVKKPSYNTKPIEKIIVQKAVPAHLITLAQQLSEYYAVDLGTTISLILPRGVEKKRRQTKTEEPQLANMKQKHLQLTDEQTAAIATIAAKPDTYLLKGVTGSGKTRVYIELAQKTLQNKQGVVILVPEIGLTSQMVDEFKAYFGSDVFIIHSNQTEATRHTLWEAIRVSETPIVIGPRSALFSPVKALGLLVVDEEHETSYKQDMSPKYHAVRAASMLRKLTSATLVLGSATPSIEDYHRASQQANAVVELTQPVKELAKTTVHIVDMKERDGFKKSKWLGDEMLQQITKTIDVGKQALVFQNRRGNATSVICQNCGWVDECPNCLIPLTHHRDWAKNVCHTCNYSHAIMPACPDCKEPELIYKGAGTKELFSELTKHFPGATIERFDGDVTDKEEKLESRYQAIIDGEIDIIVGTQMIAKGLDIPKLGLVGIANADTSLYLPDFSSAERTFQLIAQVVGRVGRHTAGTVVIQTYSPKSPSVELATTQDWDTFYEKELKERELAGYPPFQFLLKLSFEAKTDGDARADTQRFAQMLRTKIADVSVLGPSPDFHHKTRTGWRWQIVIKSANRAKLVHIARNIPGGWQFELDPINLL